MTEKTLATTVRKATATDMSSVLRLIRELAVYEKCPDEVEVTEEELLQDGFGDRKIFNCFVAEVDDNIVGFALYYTKYSTWKGKCLFLEDFIVTEKYRGRGIGKMLFEQVIQIAKQEKVKRMEWQVLEWNEPALSFYRKYNPVLDPEWLNAKLVYDQIQSITL